ncbi:MAG: hypothetical protein ACRC4M_04325 [Mycoplasma sp.]
MNDVNIYLVSDNLVKYLEDKNYNSALGLWNSNVKDVLIENKKTISENKESAKGWVIGFSVGVVLGIFSFVLGGGLTIISITELRKGVFY